MIGILGGMGTQAGLDFCNKLAKLNRGKMDQNYPMFILYNKSNTPKRPENLKKYSNVLKALVAGCRMLQKNKCKFIVMPCNTAHYWHKDVQKSINVPLISMPKEVFNHTKSVQKSSVNKAIKLVKMGKVKDAEKAIKASVNFLIRKKCKKIILGCTELPIAIFAYKSFKKAKESKTFIDPNLLLAEVCMKKYRS